MTHTFDFPGGSVAVDASHIEKKLAEFLKDPADPAKCTRACELHFAQGAWRCRLWVGAEHYAAGSRLGLLDSIANALQAAQGREEIV